MTAALHVSLQSAPGPDSQRSADTRTNASDDGLAAFIRVRPRLLAIAYRMLRSSAEAEDVVQDVWVRWQAADRGVVRDAAAFLATTTKRLAINVMQSARVRREASAAWPRSEPADTRPDPRLKAERDQALASGLLLLLERLTPVERAAYILREALDHPYRDIAALLGLAEANARQVVTRARARLANGRRMRASSTEQRRLFDAFVATARDGDVAWLERSLCVDCRQVPTPHPIPVARTGMVDGSIAGEQVAAA